MGNYKNFLCNTCKVDWKVIKLQLPRVNIYGQFQHFFFFHIKLKSQIVFRKISFTLETWKKIDKNNIYRGHSKIFYLHFLTSKQKYIGQMQRKLTFLNKKLRVRCPMFF